MLHLVAAPGRPGVPRSVALALLASGGFSPQRGLLLAGFHSTATGSVALLHHFVSSSKLFRLLPASCARSDPCSQPRDACCRCHCRCPPALVSRDARLDSSIFSSARRCDPCLRSIGNSLRIRFETVRSFFTGSRDSIASFRIVGSIRRRLDFEIETRFLARSIRLGRALLAFANARPLLGFIIRKDVNAGV